MRISCRNMTQFRFNIHRPVVSQGNHLTVALSSSCIEFRWVVVWVCYLHWYSDYPYGTEWFYNVLLRNPDAKVTWPGPESGWCCEHPEGRYCHPDISPILVRCWHIVACTVVIYYHLGIHCFYLTIHNTWYSFKFCKRNHIKIMLSTDQSHRALHLWKRKKNVSMHQCVLLYQYLVVNTYAKICI